MLFFLQLSHTFKFRYSHFTGISLVVVVVVCSSVVVFQIWAHADFQCISESEKKKEKKTTRIQYPYMTKHRIIHWIKLECNVINVQISNYLCTFPTNYWASFASVGKVSISISEWFECFFKFELVVGLIFVWIYPYIDWNVSDRKKCQMQRDYRTHLIPILNGQWFDGYQYSFTAIVVLIRECYLNAIAL